MKRQEVVDAFFNEFKDDLPPPPKIKTDTPEKYQKEKESYVKRWLHCKKLDYNMDYGELANEKFNADKPQLTKELENEFDEIEKNGNESRQKHLNEEHNEKLKTELSSQLRRYNIAHPEFPKKYRDTFTQARKECLTNILINDIQDPENIAQELQDLYAYIKRQIIMEQDPNTANAKIQIALNILKTISTIV